MNKEYIDKHEAYMLIEREAETHELPATKEAYERAALIVDQMRPANIAIIEPRTGHWICDYKGDHVADYHCSECGRQLGFAFSTQNKKILGGRWKYCDVCGAKMKGEVE